MWVQSDSNTGTEADDTASRRTDSPRYGDAYPPAYRYTDDTASRRTDGHTAYPHAGKRFRQQIAGKRGQ